MNEISCSRCHRDTELTIIGFADGEADSLRIRLKDLPLLVCAEGHRQFVRAEFPAELLEHLTRQDEPELPSGEKWLIVKRYLCEDCGAELEARPSPQFFVRHQAGRARCFWSRADDAGLQVIGLRP